MRASERRGEGGREEIGGGLEVGLRDRKMRMG